MSLDYLRLLYAYNDWANQRILDEASNLSQAQLHAPDDGGYGSVHTTLVHTMEAEWTWASIIWSGKAFDIDWDSVEFDPADYPDVAAIRARWADVEAFLKDFVAALTPDGENSPEQIISWPADDGAIRRRKLWPLMLHVANHGTQHRSEVAMALTRFGYSPGDLDLSYYLRLHFPEEPD